MAYSLLLSWFALTVKPRHEKAVASALTGKQFDAFLPTYVNRNPSSRRQREFALPLFPGYVFCRFDPAMRLPILIIPGVVSVVCFGKSLVPVDELEINALQKLVESKLPLKECDYFASGDRVRIETGPLRGVTGIVDRRSGSNRFVVSISILQRSVSVTLDENWITPVDAAAQQMSRYC